MIRKSEPTNPAAPCREKDYSILAGLSKAVWVAPAVAVFIVILYLVLGHIRLSDTGYRFLESLCYSALIGFPSAVVLTWISVNYTDRFPRLVIAMRVFALLCTAMLGSLAASLFLRLVGVFSPSQLWPEFWGSLPFATVITLVVGMGIASFETMRYRLQAATLELRTRQVEQERAYKLLAEARLSSLESRIHPHFLFNTLNSIAALIPSDPTRAEDTVGKLASLLRFSLSAQHSGLVPLGQELRIVRDYLEIEKTRFGARLNYKIEVPEHLESVSVPPLAVQSLVENAVKHVVSKRAQGASILITGQVAGSSAAPQVRLEVVDDGPGFSLESITPEHGLGNLVARLELLFAGKGRLEVLRDGGHTVVRLTFPVQ
jgi:sensor histidine kinase YesM